MFTTEHFIWLGICVAIIAILTYLSLKLNFSFKTSAFIMAAVSLVSETSKILSHMEFVNGENSADGMVIDAGALPLHLCSLLIFVFFYLPFCKNEKHKNYLTSLVIPVGLVGSLLAIIMATSGTDFTSSEAYQCFIYHAVMVWFAIYLVAKKHAELGVRAYVRNLVTVGCLAIAMIWINGALQAYDTNFLYVVRPPVDGLPILNLDNGWYAYFGVLILCGFVGITAVHLPFMIKEIKNNKKEREMIAQQKKCSNCGGTLILLETSKWECKYCKTLYTECICKKELANQKTLSVDEVYDHIESLKKDAADKGNSNIILRSGDVHKELGLKNRMPTVCGAMRKAMRDGDVILHKTPSGNSSTLMIEYFLK